MREMLHSLAAAPCVALAEVGTRPQLSSSCAVTFVYLQQVSGFTDCTSGGRGGHLCVCVCVYAVREVALNRCASEIDRCTVGTMKRFVT